MGQNEKTKVKTKKCMNLVLKSIKFRLIKTEE